MDNDKTTEIKELIKTILYNSVKLQRLKERRRVNKYYIFFNNYPLKKNGERRKIFDEDEEVFDFLCRIVYDNYGINMKNEVEEGVYEFMNETRAKHISPSV